MFRVEKLGKSFGKQTVIKNFTKTFEPGKIYAIVGESGKGKTTLIRMMAGLDKTTTGHVFLDEKQMKRPNKDIFLLDQQIINFDWKSARANVLAYKEEPDATDKEKAEEILISLGLTEQEFDKFPYELSGGQNQRVALGRMLFTNPKVLLLDEPTSALDKESTALVLNTLTKLKKQQVTIIMVTHSEQAANFADEKIIL